MLMLTSVHILCTYLHFNTCWYIFCKTLLLRCLSCYKHVTYLICNPTLHQGVCFHLRYIARLTVRTTEYYIGVKCAIPPPCTPISSAYDTYPLEILIVSLPYWDDSFKLYIFTTHTYEASYGLMMSGLVWETFELCWKVAVMETWGSASTLPPTVRWVSESMW